VRWFDALLGRSPVVTAALDSSAGPSFSVDIDPAVFGLTSYADPIAPAARISRREAIQLPAVKRVRDLIAGTIGQLPLDVYDTSKVTLVNDLLIQPERNCARSITITKTAEDILLEGISWWRVVERNWEGYPRFVQRIDPWRVNVDDTAGVVKIDGKVVADRDLIRFDSPNDGLLLAGARAIRTALRLDTAAANMAADPIPQGYFKPTDGADPVSDDDIAEILTDWRTARQSGSTGYIPASLEYVTLSWDAKQLQLAEGRQAAVLEIARIAGVDAEELGVSTTSRTYFNADDRRQSFIDFVLGPYLVAIEQRLSLGDVTKRGMYVKFNVSALLRGDTLARYQAYEIGLRVGAVAPDEIRELEDKPALPAQEAPVPAPTASQFDDHEVITFDAPAAAAEFKVDLDKRTITGLAVPYGQTAQSEGRVWQFHKGSLKFDDVSRVKFLDGHDWSKPIGRAVKLDDTDAGLVATFKVVATPAGDEALLMASDLVKDGLSVGIALGGTYDERDGVTHAVAAPLAEISLTPCPAFDSARVTAVAASNHKEGTEMTETQVTTPAEASVNFDAITKAITDGFAAAKPAEGPEVVSATAALSVTEPLPYRFDGAKGEHDFSTDLFAVARHNDGESKQRLDKFMDAAFDVSVANVATLNPNTQRPDLYVDQLDYTYPVWNSINKGTIADQTPFVIPKFGTSSGLVADHVESTEPTEGAFTATSQTITPTPTSGKVEIPREVIDAGGNPQVSGLIWRQMQRAYNEALEAKAVALLDGLTPTGITITTAAADAVLEGELTAALAALQYVRGGNRFNQFMVQIDLYKRLVAAKDTTGRKLFPIINPQNATGTTDAGFGYVMVGGLKAQPAWALAATGAVAASSYLYNSDDVHGWATPPKQFTFEYRVSLVDLAVWGYKALANTRLEGVREVIYDPTV